MVGQLTLKEDGNIIKTIDLTVKEDIKKANIFELYLRYLKQIFNWKLIFQFFYIYVEFYIIIYKEICRLKTDNFKHIKIQTKNLLIINILLTFVFSYIYFEHVRGSRNSYPVSFVFSHLCDIGDILYIIETFSNANT